MTPEEEKEFDEIPSDEGGLAVERMHPTDIDKVRLWISEHKKKWQEEARGALTPFGEQQIRTQAIDDCIKEIEKYFDGLEVIPSPILTLKSLKQRLEEMK